MDSGVKQRIIGAAVLGAVAVIFLPSLLFREVEPEIDTTTQVPIAPKFEFEPIPEPSKPLGIDTVENPDELFQPVPEQPEDVPNSVQQNSGSNTSSSETLSVPPKISEPKQSISPPADETDGNPSLDEYGLPKAWVLQVGSFSNSERAQEYSQKLIDDGFKAFVRPFQSDNKTVYRVLVGPNINRNDASDIKVKIDAAYRIDSLIMRYQP
ncbi:SPOR domain-containing protein [Sessilibacter sp. MAH1]